MHKRQEKGGYKEWKNRGTQKKRELAVSPFTVVIKLFVLEKGSEVCGTTA